MSSSGINPLAIVAPDLYAKQLAIQQRQALAQSLLQQGSGDPGRAAYGGLRNAGNAILGAFLAKRGNQDLANLYSPQPDDSAAASPMPQVSNSPQPDASNAQAMGQALQGGQPQQSTPVAQPQAQPQASQPRTPAAVLGGAIPDLPGLTHQQSMLAYIQSPNAYFTALAAANSPTEQQKNARFAYPGDAQGQQGIVAAGLTKSGTIPVTRGMALVPDGRGGMVPVYAPPTAPEGYQNQAGPNGLQIAPVQGGPQAVAGSSMAKAAGGASVTPFTGYDVQGMPQATNNLAMTGNPAAQNLIPGINPSAVQSVESGGNPYAVSPAGARGPMQTMPGTLQNPGFGVRPAQNDTPQEQGRVGNDYLSAMQAKYNNPVLAHIANNMGPAATDRWVAAGADFSKLPQETQMYLGRVAVAQAMPQRQSGILSSSGLMPALPASQGPYMASQGKDAAERHDATVAAASESPMRINVLDNIINLSKSGVSTGPGQEFQNSVLGYAANVPGLSALMSGAKDNVGKFQELQKFTYQNAIRSWQAAGGTGTDAQMQSMAHANPNDHLFPQALQQIAQWGKAGELAVQGKANAQDSFLQQNGQTPSNQIKFENTWRNAFDPKVFQYALMDPTQKQTFAQQELKTPQAAKMFLAKQQQLKQLGAIQ